MKGARLQFTKRLGGVFSLASAMCGVSDPLLAQSCLGISGRNAPIVNLSGGAMKHSSAMEYRVRGGVAVQKAFGGFQVGQLEATVPNVNSLLAGADVGMPIVTGASRAWTVCPVVAWSYLSGNGVELGRHVITNEDIERAHYRVDSHTLAPGVAIGREFELNARTTLLPFVSAMYLHTSAKVWNPYASERATRHQWKASAGTGVQVDRKFLIRLEAGRTALLNDSKLSFGFSGGYLFRISEPRDPFRR